MWRPGSLYRGGVWGPPPPGAVVIVRGMSNPIRPHGGATRCLLAGHSPGHSSGGRTLLTPRAARRLFPQGRSVLPLPHVYSEGGSLGRVLEVVVVVVTLPWMVVVNPVVVGSSTAVGTLPSPSLPAHMTHLTPAHTPSNIHPLQHPAHSQ